MATKKLLFLFLVILFLANFVAATNVPAYTIQDLNVYYPDAVGLAGKPNHRICGDDLDDGAAGTCNPQNDGATSLAPNPASIYGNTGTLRAGELQEFIITVKNTGGADGSPNQFFFTNVAAANDVIGSKYSIAACGCGGQVWTASTVGTAIKCAAGTTCTISKNGGFANFYIRFTNIGIDAGDNSVGDWNISDSGGRTATSNTTTFNVGVPSLDINEFQIYASSAADPETDTLKCEDTVNNNNQATCDAQLVADTNYRIEFIMKNTGGADGIITSIDWNRFIVNVDGDTTCPFGVPTYFRTLNCGCGAPGKAHPVGQVASTAADPGGASTPCAIGRCTFFDSEAATESQCFVPRSDTNNGMSHFWLALTSGSGAGAGASDWTSLQADDWNAQHSVPDTNTVTADDSLVTVIPEYDLPVLLLTIFLSSFAFLSIRKTHTQLPE